MKIEQMTHLEDMKALGRLTYLEYAKTATIRKGDLICFEGNTVRLNKTPQLAIDTYIQFVRKDGGKLRDLIHGHLFDIGMRRALYDLVKVEILDACSSDGKKTLEGKDKKQWLADEERLLLNSVAWLKMLNETWEAKHGG